MLGGSDFDSIGATALERSGRIVGGVAYIVVQLIGGTLGAFALSSVLGATAVGLGATVLAANVTPVQGFVVELILTFFLVNTIFNTAVNGKARNLAPVAIGLTLVFAVLMGGPLTGASLNPARTLGPAIMTGNYSNLSIYPDRPATRGHPRSPVVPARSEGAEVLVRSFNFHTTWHRLMPFTDNGMVNPAGHGHSRTPS
jgi:hypothetical protein